MYKEGDSQFGPIAPNNMKPSFQSAKPPHKRKIEGETVRGRISSNPGK
jgi:hypothetical protein